MDSRISAASFLALTIVAIPEVASAQGDAANGEKYFNASTFKCYACHSLEPGEQKIGPSLAGLFGRQAGSLPGFKGYSEAMVKSGVVWNEDSLNNFLADPQKFIPGNTMLEAGYYQSGQITSEKLRADVIAYLKQATAQ